MAHYHCNTIHHGVAPTQQPSTSLYAKLFHLTQRYHNGYDHHGGKGVKLNRRVDVSRCRRFCRKQDVGVGIVHAAADGCSSANSQPHLLVHLLALNSFFDEVDCSMNTLKRKREYPDSSVPPPQGWKRHFSRSSGQEYFLHVESNHTQWEYPSQSEVENPIAARKRRDDAERERANALRLRREEKDSSRSRRGDAMALGTTMNTLMRNNPDS